MSVVGFTYILYILLACLCVTSMACGYGYFSGENRECLHCPPKCLSCDSDEDCLSCINGYWGRTCEIPCTKCKTGTSCEKTDGFCLEACRDGYSGLLCDAFCDKKCFSCKRKHTLVCLKCASGRYPLSLCNRICSTCINTACDENGVCTSGCLNGYWGETCESVCPQHCLNKTRNNKACDENGFCTTGCLNGYWGETCESVCPQHCLNKTCEWKIGNCTHGCEGNYTGPMCNIEHNDVHRGTIQQWIVPVVIAVPVLVAILCLVFCCVKRCRRRNKPRKEKGDGAEDPLQLQADSNGSSQTSPAVQNTANPNGIPPGSTGRHTAASVLRTVFNFFQRVAKFLPRAFHD